MDVPLVMENQQYGVLKSAKNLGVLKYRDGRFSEGNLTAEMKYDRIPASVQRVMPSLQIDAKVDIVLLPNQASIVPDSFNMRIALDDIKNYVHHQINPNLAAAKLQLLNPTFDFNGNRIKINAELKVAGVPGSDTGDTREIEAQVELEGRYELRDAERATDQQMEINITLNSLRCKEVPLLDSVVSEYLRRTVFNKPRIVYPLRDADAPVKALLKEVTVHELTMTDFGNSVVVHGKCKPIKNHAR
jgi:hypothetical protein